MFREARFMLTVSTWLAGHVWRRAGGDAPQYQTRALARRRHHEDGTAPRRRSWWLWGRFTPASAGVLVPRHTRNRDLRIHPQIRTQARLAIGDVVGPTKRSPTKKPSACPTLASGPSFSMKHVGLNVAADPFINSALTGVNGGIVLVVADDPGMHSSQNEQDSRYYGEFAQIPVIEPANQQEGYELTKEAFDISEKLNLPVMIRLVTRLAHSRATVHVDETISRTDRAESRLPAPDANDWTLVPSNARRRFRRLVEMQPAVRDWSTRMELNSLRLAGPVGIIASGIAYNYVREALGREHDYSLLRISTYPIPVEKVRSLVSHCNEIWIVEEGYPFIETRLNGLLGVPGKAIRGKLSGDLPSTRELTPDIVAAALGQLSVVPAAPIDDLALRPPALCRGCPHADTFKALIDAGTIRAAPCTQLRRVLRQPARRNSWQKPDSWPMSIRTPSFRLT